MNVLLSSPIFFEREQAVQMAIAYQTELPAILSAYDYLKRKMLTKFDLFHCLSLLYG